MWLLLPSVTAARPSNRREEDVVVSVTSTVSAESGAARAGAASVTATGVAAVVKTTGRFGSATISVTSAVSGTALGSFSALLLENGDYLLLETGDKLLLEAA